jgi:hypothetical protein
LSKSWVFFADTFCRVLGSGPPCALQLLHRIVCLERELSRETTPREAINSEEWKGGKLLAYGDYRNYPTMTEIKRDRFWLKPFMKAKRCKATWPCDSYKPIHFLRGSLQSKRRCYLYGRVGFRSVLCFCGRAERSQQRSILYKFLCCLMCEPAALIIDNGHVSLSACVRWSAYTSRPMPFLLSMISSTGTS